MEIFGVLDAKTLEWNGSLLYIPNQNVYKCKGRGYRKRELYTLENGVEVVVYYRPNSKGNQYTARSS